MSPMQTHNSTSNTLSGTNEGARHRWHERIAFADEAVETFVVGSRMAAHTSDARVS